MFVDGWERLTSGNLLEALPVALLASFLVAAFAIVATRPR